MGSKTKRTPPALACFLLKGVRGFGAWLGMVDYHLDLKQQFPESIAFYPRASVG